MLNLHSVRRTSLSIALAFAVLAGVLPTLPLSESPDSQVSVSRPSAPTILAGDDTKTGGGPG